jgi:hypothetical protein
VCNVEIVLRIDHCVKVVEVDDVAEEFEVVLAAVEIHVGYGNSAKVVGYEEGHRPVNTSGHKVGVSRNIEFE